jgi:hypothetical protein
VDDLMRTALRTARDEVEGAVDVDTAWRELTARAEAGDDPVSVTAGELHRPVLHRWSALVAAAAAIAVVAGAVAVLDRPDEIRTVDTAPSTVSTSAPTTNPAPTTAAPTTAPPGTTNVVAAPDGRPTIAVSYASLPRTADFDRMASTSYAAPGQAEYAAAIGDLGVAIVGPGSVTVLSWDGTTREVAIELPGLASPLYGPGDVLYGLDVAGERGMVAVALSGSRSGEVVAATPLPEGPGDAWGAVGANSFAHGADGVVDVAITTGAPTLIGYVDVDGAPLEWPGVPLADIAHDVTPVEGDPIDATSVLSVGGWAVSLSIERSPGWAEPNEYPGPGRGPRGAVVYPVDLGPVELQGGTVADVMAIAVLREGGDAFWSTIDPTFEFVASSPWGVLVKRINPESLSITWATLFLAPVTDPATLDAEPTGVAPSCAGGLACGDVAVAPDGTLVSYDAASGELTVHREPAVVAELDPATFLSIAAVGADDTVYVVTSPVNGTAEEGNDVVAVSMAADRAGLIVRRWAHAIGMSGDSELVATPEGIVVVGCCGMDTVRPEPGTPVAVPWVDRDGTEVALDAPTVRFDQVADIVTVGERAWSLDLPVLAGDRGMPMITATSDRGFVGFFVDWSTPDTATVVRGRPDGTVELTVVAGIPAFLTPDGRVGLAVDGQYVLTDPFAA